MNNKIKEFIRKLYKSKELPYNPDDYLGYLKTDTEFKAIHDNCMIHIDHTLTRYRIEPYKNLIK
tara:strand:+ start:2664 stop:2855 length:192 start_codon:yes stop_codon:yes gene_type:complete